MSLLNSFDEILDLILAFVYSGLMEKGFLKFRSDERMQ